MSNPLPSYLFKRGVYVKKICGVYKITNNINNNCYIGSSIDIYKRWREHRARSEINTKWYKETYYNHLYCAFRKYGRDNFTYEIIEIISNIKDLLLREQYWYDYYKPQYNKMRPDRAPICAGKPHTQETKDKIGKHNAKYWKDKKLSKEMINNIVNGNKNKRKQVLMINKENNEIIKEFDGICNALEYLGRNRNETKSISNCCKGISKLAYGYKWEYKQIKG